VCVCVCAYVCNKEDVQAQIGVWMLMGRYKRHDDGWMCRVCVCVQ